MTTECADAGGNIWNRYELLESVTETKTTRYNLALMLHACGPAGKSVHIAIPILSTELEYIKMHGFNYTADVVANGFEQAEFRDRGGCWSMCTADSYETTSSACSHGAAPDAGSARSAGSGRRSSCRQAGSTRSGPSCSAVRR